MKGIDVNVPEKEGCTALYMAAWQGKDRCVELLLGMGKDICDVNARNLSGQHRYTPYINTLLTPILLIKLLRTYQDL